MGHDASKVLLGTTQFSDKEVQNYNSDPATFVAGLAVRLNSSGALSLTSTDGLFAGISLGKSLSDNKRTAVARMGLRVPILLTDEYEPVVGELVYIDNGTGMANASDADDGDPEEPASIVTVSNAVFVSGVLTGIDESGAEVSCALVDMPGGL